MIIALAADDRSLMVFRSIESAAAHCEAIDVEDGFWSFWDEACRPMRPVFSVPNERSGSWVGNGTYTLEPAPHLECLALAEALWGAVHLEPNPYFPSLAALQEHLASAKPVTQHGA